MTITACITVKNRGEALRHSLVSLIESGVDQIVVTDWHSNDIKFKLLASSNKITWLELDGDFSIGRGKNEAAKLATSDIIFFIDADVMVSKEVLDMARQVCELGLVYVPIMWMAGQGWGINSFGQVAILRGDWVAAEPWPEWTSYGGEDNIFVYQFEPRIVRDLQKGLVHQYHEHALRERYYKGQTGSDLAKWNKDNNWSDHARRRK